MRRILRSAVLIVIVVMSVAMMYLPYVELKKNAVEDLNERQELIVNQTALSIETFFAEQRKMLRHFAMHPTFINFNADGALSIQREYINSSDYVKAITRYDSDGIIMYSYPYPEDSIGKDISAQAHVKKILAEHKPNISDVFTAVQGYETVALSEPIFDGDEFVGVVAFLIDFKFIARNFLENIRIGENGYAWMISRDGTELYCPIHDHSGKSIKDTAESFPSAMRMVESMMRGESGVTSYIFDRIKDKETEIIKKYAVYAPIKLEDTFWSVAVSTPESDVYADLYVFIKKMLFALLMLVSALMVYVVISVHDYNLAKRNEELQKLVDAEIAKREKQEKIMLQQARFYSMTETLNAIAHQWRQPLNAIGLCVQDLEEAYESGELDKQYLSETVEKTMERLMSLSTTIDDFRTFFVERKEAAEVNLCEEIMDIYNVVRVKYDAIGISCKFTVDNAPLDHAEVCSKEQYRAKIYPDKLKQAVLNCLSNSREAIERLHNKGTIYKGEIWIKLGVKDGVYDLEIIDNGGGIDESIKDRIFDPYFTTKETTLGMGQGLYVTRMLVEESLGGSISVDNINKGVRVSFKFRSL
jgi:signal transduction histidine kinase